MVGAAGVTIALGLASRRPGVPPFVLGYVGDALYAVLLYWLFAFVRPNARPGPVSLAALLCSAAVELSQAWHPAWLDELRAHRLVALVLGRGFVWSDLICYAVGAGIAGTIDTLVRRPRRANSRAHPTSHRG